MKLIEDLKNKIGRWQLEREFHVQRHKPERIPFEQMEKVGMIYHAGDVKNEQVVTTYANELRAQGKKVFMLGFVNEKELPSSKKFLFNSEFFWREKLNGINLPIRSKIGQFLLQEFDLLLNLYLEPVLPLQAVSVYSPAHYKVGSLMETGSNYADFMLDLGPKRELAFLIEQLDFYLKNIT